MTPRPTAPEKAAVPGPEATSVADAFDPLELTVFAQGVAMLAEEMGTLLERSALSPNIRERRDASCALFDAQGRMVAQAAHIPVHLGAMPEAVAAVRAAGAVAGDLFLLNDPAHGGSHLPDLTMVEVIADPDDAAAIIGFAAVRAHHADVGGMSPGSMPFGATELFQEGIIIPPVRLEVAGRPQEDVRRLLLANVRTPAERDGDLRAQRAACAAGREGWQALHRRMGATVLPTRCWRTPNGGCVPASRCWRGRLAWGGTHWRGMACATPTFPWWCGPRCATPRWSWTSPAPARRCRAT
jgi:N-methylhydantoinase B